MTRVCMQQPQDTRLLLTPREAARALALSPRTQWGLTACEELVCVRIGKRGVRYDIQDLRAWIAQQKERRA